ncbi:sulfotransferase domain-containing protein [Fodinibius salsisoli]|uniref:Sulfotransferase domain-containing protein n=1 Tax=Fodinibius salsisoli TaxID=2820877 RepID=A0ABT3PKE5_9BACT|nr:sulfotransferase domain-containing protein [Fodinibius salsisoli]MCW9706397.1 sulfotransferase domain-containing protein [Fodinibius salsisoli]
MNLRNAFIAGAAKSGTTTLYYLLEQHPEVAVPAVKEPNYFSNIDNNEDPVKAGTGPGDDSTVWTRSQQEYHNLYRPSDKHTVKLDASVSYLYSTTAAEQIATYDPDSRIIIVLRNPTERAFSHYKHLLRDGRETEPFEEALALEQSRIDKGWEFSWHLTAMGMYSQQIQRYLDHFDAEQLHIITLKDIKNDLPDVISDITDFLGLSPFEYDLERQERNASGVARSWILSRMVNWVLGYKATINKIIPPKLSHKALQLFRSFNIKKGNLEISEDTRRELATTFKEDINKTESLIGRSLKGWLND